jgi:hypothetical protein
VDPKPGRGWGVVAGLALVAAACSVVSPGLLISLLVTLFFVALPPRRPAQVAVAAGLAWVIFRATATHRFIDGSWYVDRGWVLLIGAWFVVTVALWPAARFVNRALAALGAAAASAALLLLFFPDGWRNLDWLVSHRIHEVAALASQQWVAAGAGEWSGRFASAAYQLAELQSFLYPALLALESLAGLAVAWWIYHRVATGEPNPLGRWRDFRFGDHLVWLLVAGILLLLLPLGSVAGRAGSNLLAFMSALYALRGSAVLLTIFGLQGVGGALIATLALLFLYPLTLTTAVLVGLTDTWVDLRARRAAPRPGS